VIETSRRIVLPSVGAGSRRLTLPRASDRSTERGRDDDLDVEREHEPDRNRVERTVRCGGEPDATGG